MNLQGNTGCPCAEFVSACGKLANYNRWIDEAASIHGASHGTPSAFLFLLVVDGLYKRLPKAVTSIGYCNKCYANV